MISVGHLWVVLLLTTGCHLALCCLLMSASLLESMAAASLHFQWVVSSSPPAPCLMQVHISQQSLGVGSHSPPVTPSTTWPRFLRHQCVPHSTEMGGRIGTGRGAMTSDTLGDSMKTLFLEDALLIFSLAANYPFPHL